MRMQYFYQDTSGAKVGPYTRDELRQLHLSGVVKAETPILAGDTENFRPFHELWTEWHAAPEDSQRVYERFAARTREDLRALAPQLLLPFREARDFDWLKNRKLIAIAAIGLVPLLIHATTSNLGAAFWGMALYFSALWALFFYHVFPTPEARLSTVALCFFASGVLSISVLLMAYHLPPLMWLVQLFKSPNFFNHMLGYIVAVALPEELCKALPIFVLLKKSNPLPPQVMVFYGLMAGLGFGIYEGVDYQMERNFRYAGSGGEYYLLNVLRLTTLPFLHAMWTGIAGYFIGFAGLYPRRQRGLMLIGVGVPVILHGLYNTFNGTIIGLGFALLTVLALNLYLARSMEFEEALIERNLTDMP
jgi:RsiW-degrading membrane proteinase PrsW (M82 family)